MTQTWGIVLAAGRGRRLAEVTGGVPKQFWRAGAGQTLLEDTLDRLSAVAPLERTVVVVDGSHEPYVRALALAGPHVLYQPQDRGTAAGVLLSLLPILDADPDAIVVMTPADHGVGQVSQFRNGLIRAVRRVRRRGEGIILFGVEPAGNDGSYGWIRPGRARRGGHTREVAGFVEKPGAERASLLLQEGAVWNTMVLVADIQSLRRLIASRQPELYAEVLGAWRASGRSDGRSLDGAYARVRCADFSRDVITGVSGLEVAIWPHAMGWSDLGTPERLFAWLEGPPALAAASSAA